MILPEDRPESPSKLQPPQQQQEPEQAPPPAYEASGSGLAAGLGDQTVYVPVVLKRGPRAGPRFCQALFIGVFVYVVLGALLSSVLETRHGRRFDHGKEHEDADTARPDPRNDGMVLSPGCVKGPHRWENGAVSFQLARTNDVLYFYTRGIQLGGNVHIMNLPIDSDPNVITVDVTALHSTPEWLNAVSVCSLERKPGEQGVAIFSPKRWRSKTPLPELEFEVAIRLPRQDDDVLQIARLETDMPNFTHHIGDLQEHILFRNISLKSTNQHMFSQSLKAMNAEIITSKSRIVGTYEASESLTLTTSNEPINITATLVHRNPDNKAGPTLTMKTTNRKIDSSINLVSALPPATYGAGGSFNVETETSNARLAIDFPNAPVDSKLKYIGRTTNANAHVNLHPTFEGQIKASTSGDAATIDQVKPPHDPSGRNRDRHFMTYANKGKAHAEVIWDGMYMGSVDVSTTNQMAEVYV